MCDGLGILLRGGGYVGEHGIFTQLFGSIMMILLREQLERMDL